MNKRWVGRELLIRGGPGRRPTSGNGYRTVAWKTFSVFQRDTVQLFTFEALYWIAAQRNDVSHLTCPLHKFVGIT